MQRIAAILALVLLSVGPCRPAWAGPFTVGVGLGLSGPHAALAEDHRDGLLLWADDINARGGILDRTVELDVMDIGGDPARAAEAYDELVSREDVDWLLAPPDDDAALAAVRAVNRSGRAMLAGAATADALWNNGNGRVLGMLVPASRHLTDFLAMLVLAGADRVALAGGSGPYAEAACDGAGLWARRFDMDVVFSRQPAGDDWDAVVDQARAAGAQALIVCGAPHDAEAAVRAVRRARWRPMALLATTGPCMDDFARRLGDAAEGVFTVSVWEYDPGLDGVRRFEADFERRFHRRPSYVAASAYAAGEVLAAAALRAGSDDQEDLLRAMRSLDVMTVVGRFAVESDGRQARQAPVVLQWQDGRAHVVWPTAFARTEPEFAH